MMSLKSVEKLKADWLADPCWDIEETGEGFEIFREDLLAFRLETQKRRKQERVEELEARSIELGIPGNHALVRYIETLEARIENLSDRILDLEY
jgi:hypothetical protein